MPTPNETTDDVLTLRVLVIPEETDGSVEFAVNVLKRLGGQERQFRTCTASEIADGEHGWASALEFLIEVSGADTQ